MYFHEAIARDLSGQGVHTIFGLIGDANLFMVDSFRGQPGTRYVSVANESAAVQAAAGFAQTSGELGVATVTHGPAFTNTMTALADA